MLMGLKPFLPLVVLVFSTVYANAQELYQYTKGSVITTSVGQIFVLDIYNINMCYSQATPVYNQHEPSTCSDPTIKRNQYGDWIVDKTRYTKPSQTAIYNSVKSCFAGYHDLLKSAFDGKGQIGIAFHTDSTGEVLNTEVKIWAEPSIYRQIPPEVLCGFLNVLDDLQFTIPPEYQCISDHYFRYSVFFKDL
ncbi:MAG: hypothetical protein E7130_03090 [Rikenellaceae bacterium]|nr:hypothetical protein [Rikenellaceae bacterium]